MSRHHPSPHLTWLSALGTNTFPPLTLYAWTLSNLAPSPQSSPSSSSLHTTTTSTTFSPSQLLNRFYILGAGNLGTLYTFHLARHLHAQSLPPPILVVRRLAQLQEWAHTSPRVLSVRPHGSLPSTFQAHHTPQGSVQVEWWSEEKPSTGPVREIGAAVNPSSASSLFGGDGVRYKEGKELVLRNVIVTTKTSHAMEAVDRLRGYLSAKSTVLFVQNGMNPLWPPVGHAYEALRYPSSGGGGVPTWLHGVTTHGVSSAEKWLSVFCAPADIVLGSVSARKLSNHATEATAAAASVPAESTTTTNEDSDADRGGLLSTLLAIPELHARQVSRAALWVVQLEKLASNCVINPLTALLRVRNGDILSPTSVTASAAAAATEADAGADRVQDDEMTALIDMLIREISILFQALVAHPSAKPILTDDVVHDSADSMTSTPISRSTGISMSLHSDDLIQRFSHESLKAHVLAVIQRVGANKSSMLQDVEAGKETEIRQFNGWLIETAQTVLPGERLAAHEALIRLVEEGKILTRDELFKRVLGAQNR